MFQLSGLFSAILKGRVGVHTLSSNTEKITILIGQGVINNIFTGLVCRFLECTYVKVMIKHHRFDRNLIFVNVYLDDFECFDITKNSSYPE